MPRQEVRLSRYRRAPTIATGTKLKPTAEDTIPAAILTAVGTSSRSRITYSASRGTPKTRRAFNVPIKSSRPVPW